ncbi:MAG: iron ABC transporter permease [Lachnospiraceae bacterium]|nr:iron ABC transporter permease [Lachnospiraceae bacterium]
MREKRTGLKILLAILFSVIVMILAVGLGSVSLSPGKIMAILFHKLFGRELPGDISASMVSILWDIRIPRAACAFIVGAMLSLSGAVVQSLLQNPLASSYTLGVSSGASLGAALIIVSGITLPILNYLLLPLTGFVFGLGTVLLVLFCSVRLDRNLRSHTIILFGMILSLFVNAILTMLSAAFSQHMQRLILWQMGSFSGRRWEHAGILLAICLAGTFLTCMFHRELDLMSFGEEDASSVGVDTSRSRFLLLILSSVLTGAAVCFTGVIGFIDLAAPHAVRRLFGASHRILLPMSALIGGAFLALADLLARTVLSPQEIPVGAVTALLGAPFFLWVYFGSRRRT